VNVGASARMPDPALAKSGYTVHDKPDQTMQSSFNIMGLCYRWQSPMGVV